MKNVIIISSLLAVVACKTEAPKEANLENELDSVSYSLRVILEKILKINLKISV